MFKVKCFYDEKLGKLPLFKTAKKLISGKAEFVLASVDTGELIYVDKSLLVEVFDSMISRCQYFVKDA